MNEAKNETTHNQRMALLQRNAENQFWTFMSTRARKNHKIRHAQAHAAPFQGSPLRNN
jgi:general stress protein 26